jgi:integrase/recombinase XerD
MDCRKWKDQFSIDLNLKYGSHNTRKTYLSCVSVFLDRFKVYREPKEVPTQSIKEWVIEVTEINSRKHRICAVKAFYQMTVGMPCKIDKIEYPRKDKKLPIVLSQEEVQQMFNVCDNLKHKVILALLYSTGMRVSELLNLRWTHLDRSRMIINVIAGKGKKDRQVPLPKEIIPLLESYWKEYKPKEYVLNGQAQLQYSSTSVNQVMKQLAEKAGIENKRVYTHLMRHNCFTHMLESGVDLNLIQRLAGHSSVKTTSLYAHISHNLISKINSPIQAINL